MKLILVSNEEENKTINNEDSKSCTDKLVKTLKLKMTNNLIILPKKESLVKKAITPPSSPKIRMPKLIKK